MFKIFILILLIPSLLKLEIVCMIFCLIHKGSPQISFFLNQDQECWNTFSVSTFDFITGICTIVGTSQLGVSQIFVHKERLAGHGYCKMYMKDQESLNWKVISASVDRGESKKFWMKESDQLVSQGQTFIKGLSKVLWLLFWKCS